MNRKYLIFVFSIWSLFYAVVMMISWGIVKENGLFPHAFEVALVTAFFVALPGVYPLAAPQYQKKHTLRQHWKVKMYKSADGMVVATIENWIHRNGKFECTGRVKRNYDDRVYQKEKNFEDADEAQVWLKVTYEKELEKHQAYNLSK